MRNVRGRCVGSRRDALKRRTHVLLVVRVCVVVVEGCVLDAVAVDFADVEVFFHFGYVARWDPVGCAPDSGRGGRVLVLLEKVISIRAESRPFKCGRNGVAYMVCQSFPKLAVDERHNSTRIFWRAAMILAVSVLAFTISVFRPALLELHTWPNRRHFFQHSASMRKGFMLCCFIPARSDGRSSQYSLGPGDLRAKSIRCV